MKTVEIQLEKAKIAEAIMMNNTASGQGPSKGTSDKKKSGKKDK